MRKIALALLAVFCLQYLGQADAAQTINGKAIGSVDDIVKEVSKGDLSLKKTGLLTLRGGDRVDDIDVFAAIFGKDGSSSTRRLMGRRDINSLAKLNWSANEPYYFRPAVSRRLYNGKRALMYHTLAPNGSFKYKFVALRNDRTDSAAAATPDELVQSVSFRGFNAPNEYTPAAFSYAGGSDIVQVYGTGVMEVKGYDREIFVGASGAKAHHLNTDKSVRLEFFAVGESSNGDLSQEPLTALSKELPYKERIEIVSLATGDFDGDRYNNEVALMVNTNNDIWIYVYRLALDADGKLVMKSLSGEKGIYAYSTDQWARDLERQPVTDMVAGDFDGDGTDEIALLFKISRRASNLANDKGWPGGPMVGSIHCKVHKWNANTRTFDTAEASKAYDRTELDDSATEMNPSATVAGVIGLRAAAADLDGDGKSEIVTLVLGYYHRRQWDSKANPWKQRVHDFRAFPHLTVWTFDRNSITPHHDDAHVKGGGESGTHNYNWGPLYDMAGKVTTGLLMNQPHLSYYYFFQQMLFPWPSDPEEKSSGINPDNLTHMYPLVDFSIAAGPFTGTLGQAKTIDDIAVAWKDKDGNDRVTVFKTKLNGAKQFDGFEDGKVVLQDKKTQGGGTWRGLVAVDLAGEGVELGKPTHLRKRSNRSYIAALNAIPYHVDTVSADGSGLPAGAQPINFTYSEGQTSVSYGTKNVTSTTNSVKQDLSQTIETMIMADPKMEGAEKFGIAKGLIGFASAIGDIAHGIKVEGMSPEERQNAVWKPDSPTAGLTEMLEFFTDRVESIDQRTNTETSKKTIDKTITATMHDYLLYTDTARHIWRYPVMTRPIPMWLAFGPRVDSNPINNPDEALKSGDKELFLTFTMNEEPELHTSSSTTDDLYNPFHEEGNFFSYPSQIGDVEGYNDAGVLADVTTWDFGAGADETQLTFEKATSNMQHTEKKVTPSGLTSTVSFFDRLINGDKATGVKMPDSDNPKTFTKEYSKAESITYKLSNSTSDLQKVVAAHRIKMQPFVAKEGAMTFGTAVEFATKNTPVLWGNNSIYQKKADPSLLLPMKFIRHEGNFIGNPHDDSAMNLRGVRFYVPDLAFFSDNRLVNGQLYEIHVPLYNASFKDTESFNVRLSWTDEMSMKATKTPIATVPVTLGGWKNESNNNKGWAVFQWRPNLTANKQYYLYVEVDCDKAIDEVHESRYGSDGNIADYGGNNEGFYPFYVYNPSSSINAASDFGYFRASDAVQLTPLYFTDGDGNTINDMSAFITNHSSDSFVTITANFNYNGPEVPYACFMGCLLNESGCKKLPNASLNTVVALDDLELEDIDDVFSINSIALFNGLNQVNFNVSPLELMAAEEIINALADSATFGVMTLTTEELGSDEEFFEGVDPTFEPEEIPDDIVSDGTTETYTLTSSENVFWLLRGVKVNGTVSASADDDEDDDNYYLELNLEIISGDDVTPSNWGKEAHVTVSSISGWTSRGEYEITVQKSTDGDEWVDAGVVKFNTEDSSKNGVTTPEPSNGGNSRVTPAPVPAPAPVSEDNSVTPAPAPAPAPVSEDNSVTPAPSPDNGGNSNNVTPTPDNGNSTDPSSAGGGGCDAGFGFAALALLTFVRKRV